MERIAPFQLAQPASFAEAVRLLAGNPQARIIAGGTDLVPNLRDGLGTPATLVDLAAVPGYATLETDGDGLAIGAGVTLARLARDPRVAARLPALVDAAHSIAGPSHRSVATVGGNLCLDTRCVYYNQSEWWRQANDHCLKHGGDRCHVAPQGTRCHAAYAGDLAPVLLVAGARLRVVGPGGARELPLGELYRDDGARHLALEQGDIVAAVRVAPAAGARIGYRKARVRGAIDFPLAGVALAVTPDGPRIGALAVAITGTDSRPLLLDGLGDFAGRVPDERCRADLATRIRKAVGPMRTTVTAANYRRQVAATLGMRLLATLLPADGG